MQQVHSTFTVDDRTFEIRQRRDDAGLHVGVFEGGKDLGVNGSISSDNGWAASFYIGPAVDHLAAAVQEHVTVSLKGPPKI